MSEQKNIPYFGKKILSKIKFQKFENMIAGATNSAIVNKFLNYIIENVDIVLSVGGAIFGILDYMFDKSINMLYGNLNYGDKNIMQIHKR